MYFEAIYFGYHSLILSGDKSWINRGNCKCTKLSLPIKRKHNLGFRRSLKLRKSNIDKMENRSNIVRVIELMSRYKMTILFKSSKQK